MGPRFHCRIKREASPTTDFRLVLSANFGRMPDVMRVVIVDDEALVRSALRIFIKSAPDLSVVGEAADGESAVQVVEEVRPDVVLMDVHMPGMGGIEATTRIRAQHPSIHVLALTTFSTERTIVPMLRAGASGFLVKDTDPARIIEAIREIVGGGFVLSSTVARAVVDVALDGPSVPSVVLEQWQQLTPREFEVVTCLAEGMSNAEIGKALFLSEATVKAHLGHIMSKWEVRDRVQVLLRAAQTGMVSIDPRSSRQAVDEDRQNGGGEDDESELFDRSLDDAPDPHSARQGLDARRKRRVVQAARLGAEHAGRDSDRLHELE